MEEMLLASASAPPVYPTLKESWAALGWCVLITLVVAMVFFIPMEKISQVQGLGKFVLALVLTMMANTLAVLWLRRRAGPQRWLGLRWRGPREQWASYALLPGLVLAEAVLLSAQSFLHLPNWAASDFNKLSSYPALALALGCVAAPITEELLFRGVLLPGLLRNYRPAVAIAQSALLFGIIHFNPAQSLNAFFTGLLLGWVYYQSRSLWLCICLHALHNTLALGARVAPGLLKNQTLLHYFSGGRYALMLVVAAVVVAGSLWTLNRLFRAPEPLVA